MYLNTHTYYSLRYGTMSLEKLLKYAQHFGVKTLAITDINNTSAHLDFVRLACNYGIKPVLGVDFRNGVTQQFVMLAKNNAGLQEINTYLSGFLHQTNALIPSRAKHIKNSFVVYPFQQQLIDLRDNEFIGVKPNELNLLKFSKWVNKLNKLVVLQTVSFQNKKDFNTHRLLRAIDNNTLLSKLPFTAQGMPNDTMIAIEKLLELYGEYPQIITNTQRILKACNVVFDFSKKDTKNQKTYSNNADLDFKLLRKLAYDGLNYRYKKVGERIFQRLEKELNIIKEKQFVSYFLINWKVLKYARSKGYYYVGRGSGANSIIAYLLRITDVDPIELDLYFERFINLHRTNPPDFDIDFSWRDRDDVMRYIFNRFKNTALIAVYNTFKYKASVRELGKVFGLPKEEIDRLTTAQFNVSSLDKLSRLVLIYSNLIKGFPNYLGIHPGGILISEKPINYYTATYLPPKGFTTTQFDMVTAEDIGLYKFDILSQRGLGKIKEAVAIAAYNNPTHKPIDIHNIKRFKEDLKIKFLLKNAKAIGCFYVESPAMRMLLKKLQVNNYLGLVAASSVIRPGVAKSGMMREYILRYRNPSRRKDAHPVLLNIMPETYGVMVYQEDVIKVAHYFGGLSLEEADMLRRGMSGKFRSREEFMKVKNKFFENCKNLGHNFDLTTEIWRQIESFAGYAFAKGHSASYAVESYQSLFLKAYYPLEYMVATLNNSGGFYRAEYYVHEARMNGAIIEPPSVNKSHYHTVIDGKTIYLGFMMLDSFEVKNATKIVSEREKNGLFLDLDNFIERVNISLEQISILIKINAFKFTKRNKRELLWEAYMKVNKVCLEEQVSTLFKSEKIIYNTPKLSSSYFDNAFDEIQYLGFPLCSPFELLKAPLNQNSIAIDLPQYIGKKVTVYGYYVTAKKTTTSKGSLMFFGTFVDVYGNHIDTVHFPQTIEKYPFKGKGIYALTGMVVSEFDCISIEIEKMEKLSIIQDSRYAIDNQKVEL